MASNHELSHFLQGVERRAFKHAVYAVRDSDCAVDIVQDAMLKLAEKYADKLPAEWPMLFQRILQNTIHDFFRRQKVRSNWTTLFSSLNHVGEEGEESDFLETLMPEFGSLRAENAADTVARDQMLNLIEAELEKLPARQREAFLLRYWEEMDVAETAAVMGCSQGSVKTHCSRAAHTLAKALKLKGIQI